MSNSHAQADPVVARTQQTSAHASAHLPQQQQQPIPSVVNPRPQASPKHKHKHKHRSAALSAIATLPPSSKNPTLSIASPSPTSSVFTSMSASTPSPAVTATTMSTVGASPASTATNGDPKRSSQPASHTSHRAASGSLDRIAALPISAAARMQEVGSLPGRDHQRSSGAVAGTSTTLVARNAKEQTAQSSSSPKPYLRKAPKPAMQTAPLPSVIVLSQPARLVASNTPSPSWPKSQLSPRPQTEVIKQTQNAGVPHQVPSRSAQVPSTSAVLSPAHVHPPPAQRVGTNGAAQSASPVLKEMGSKAPNNPQSKNLQPAQVSSPRGYHHTQPLSRPISHVVVTNTASQAQPSSRAPTGPPSERVEANSTQIPQTSQAQMALQTQIANPVSMSTSPSLASSAHATQSSKSQATAPQFETSSPSLSKTQNAVQTRVLATASPLVATQAVTPAQSQPRVQPHTPMQPHSNGIAQKPHPALAASPAPAHSASSPTDDRVTSATASEFDSSIPNDARGSFLSSTEPVNYESLLGDKQKFTPVSVVSCLALSEEEMDDLIIDHVEEQGLPLVISDLHKTAAWSSDSFSLDKYRHLAPNRGPKGEETGARNLTVGQKRSISVPDFLAHCNNVKEYSPDQPEKFYGDELPCPAAWKQALGALVHPRLQYHGEQDVSSSLSPDARSVSLACRFGPGRTCLPLQRGLCSSLGQDLMVWSDPGASSIWMIANPEDAEAVDQYISSNGGDPQTETFSPHPKELVDASFPIFCCEQKLGDLVLVPSRATHMVINTGGWTMKMAWSRMTIDTLSSALFADLPLYQRYCRPEKLHVKSMIEETLIKYTKKIESHADTALERMPEVIRDLRKLLKMYDAIIADEYVPEWRDIVREGGNDSYVECDFCGADVLHGYFECLAGETLCTLCYCQGRLCGCPDAAESLKPRQHWRTFGERLQMRNEAAQILLKVKPDLALSTDPVTDDEEDDEDDEPAPWPVRLLKEEHVEEQGWALGFLAAFRLYNLRQTSGWQSNMGTCRLCKAVLDLSQRYYCKPCRHSYCHGCLLHRLKIHPVHTLAQKDPDKFHKYHRKESSLDYKEWQHDPLVYKVEAQVNFALIEAARTKMKCMPINEKCRIGFLDVTTEHPNGLSGTLGCKKPRKNAKDKAKVSAAPSSVSATSTPVSRKRQSDVFQAPSSASPRDPTGKRARLDSPPDVEPMDEDEIALLKPHKQAVKSVRLDVAPTTSPTGISRTVTNRSIAPLTPGDNGVNLSVPTVESGIRKFVLRAGKATLVSPASPTASVASSATSQSSSVAPAAPNAKGSFTKPIAETTSKSPLTAAQPPSRAAPATNPSTGSAPSSSSAPIVAQGLVAASAPTAAAARATAPTMEVALLAAPARATAATVPSPKQPAVVPSAHVSRPEGTVPAIVAQTVERGNAGPETLAAATNAAAAGNSTGSTRPVATTIDAAGTILSTLDTTNLRIITEVVRIFYDDIKRLFAVEAEKNRKVQAEQAEELTQMRRELKEMKELLATQEEKRKESEAKQTGVMAQISHKLDVAMQQMHSKDERVEEKVERVHEMFRGLMEDIDRGARAQLEGEESMQAAEATVIESSSSSASSASGDNAQQPR